MNTAQINVDPETSNEITTDDTETPHQTWLATIGTT